jgi:hypothetical protein
MTAKLLDSPILAEHAAAIRRLGKLVVEDVIEIGRRLTEAKPIAGHGNWLAWLEREFGWSDKTAENYMRVYVLSTKFETVSNLDLDLRSLYLLGAKSTPQEVRKEIIARAEAGEQITTTAVRSAIAKTKPEPKAKPRWGVNPACMTLFENEDRLEAFCEAVTTPAARRFITLDQQLELAKDIVGIRVRAAHIQPWVSNWVREAARTAGQDRRRRNSGLL